MGRKAILKNLVDIVVMLKAEDDRRAQLDMMRQKGWIEQEDYDDAIGGLDVRDAGKNAGKKEPVDVSQMRPEDTGSLSPDDYTNWSRAQGHKFNRKTGERITYPESSQGTSPVPPKASELPKNAQGQVVGISADDPKWSATPSPTPSAQPQPSTPPVSPTPTVSPSPTPTPTPTTTTSTPESNTPPKVLPKYAKETFSKAFPGFPYF